jgi:phage-related protein
MMGKDGIARAFYVTAIGVTAIGQRLVIVRVFAKKTQRTPAREIKLARTRAKEVR